jgi:hypothetical protein
LSGQEPLALALHDVQCPAALTRPLRIWHVPHPLVPALKNVQSRHVFLSSDEDSVYSTDLRNATSAPLRSSGSVQFEAAAILAPAKATASDTRTPIVKNDRRPTSAPLTPFEVRDGLELITQQSSQILRVVARRGHRAIRRSYPVLTM